VPGSLANEDEVDGSVGSVMVSQREKTWENETVRKREKELQIFDSGTRRGRREMRERSGGVYLTVVRLRGVV